MAFILSQHKSEFGIIHESAYANIDSYSVDLINKICKVNVTIYASLENRVNKDTPVGVKTYYIKGNDFDESLHTSEFILRDTLEMPDETPETKKGVTNISTANMYTNLQQHKDFVSALPVFEVTKKGKEISILQAQQGDLVLDDDFEVVNEL